MGGESFESVWEQHKSMARRIMASHGVQSQDMDDAMQELALKLWNNWPPRTNDNLRGWVAISALNWAKSYLRKKRVDRVILHPTPEDYHVPILTFVAVPTKVQNAIDSLDPTLQATLVAVAECDGDHKQAAIILGVMPSTVSTRLHRARTRIEDYLYPPES